MMGEAAPRILPQTLPVFPYSIRRFGCRFACLLAIPQLHLALPLIEDEVLDVYALARSNPAVMIDDQVIDDRRWFCRMGTEEHQVIDAAFRLLGADHLRGAQVGELIDGQPVFWPWAAGSDAYHYVLAHWRTAGPDGHWVAEDRRGRVLYNPWDSSLAVGIAGLPDGYVIERRGVDRRLLYRIWPAREAA